MERRQDEGHSESSHQQAKERGHGRNQRCGSLDLELAASRTMRSYQVCDIIMTSLANIRMASVLVWVNVVFIRKTALQLLVLCMNRFGQLCLENTHKKPRVSKKHIQIFSLAIILWEIIIINYTAPVFSGHMSSKDDLRDIKVCVYLYAMTPLPVRDLSKQHM